MKKMINSFKNRLFLNFLLVSLITLIVSGSLLITAVRDKTTHDYEKRSLEEAAHVTDILSSYKDNVDSCIDSIVSNKQIVDSLYENDSWLKKKAYSRLYELTEGSRDNAVYYIYDKNGKCVYTTSAEENVRDIPVYWGIIRTAKAHSDALVINNGNSNPQGTDAVLNFARAIVKDSDCVGYVLASMTSDDMESLLKGAYSPDSDIILLDDFREIVYSSGNSDVASSLRGMVLNEDTAHSPDRGYIYTVTDCADYNLSIVLGRTSIFDDSLVHTMIFVILCMAVVAMIVSLIFAVIMSRILMKPLDRMTVTMNEVRTGNLNARIFPTGKDEFGQLSTDFNDMISALQMYVDLRSKQQQELNDSNVAMMQAQLNPHFLYNSLDTIKWIAKSNNMPELATISTSLAKILRASISSDNFVTLKKEEELIRNYIDIQQIRFSGKFSYDAEIPIELEDVIIPKLILQPIVENCIVHGLKNKDDGHIFLNAYENNSKLTIDIEDDGNGMTEEMLSILNKRDREQLKDHIGFYNVDTIIRLNYGLNYGLKATNLEEGGVRVTVELPIKYDI